MSNGTGDTEVKLSRRLAAVCERIPAGSRLADIGSDHALLPVYAVQKGIAAYAVAGEVNEGPLRAAQRGIEEAGLSHCIFARLGDGLDAVEAGEVNVVTIAGMGGSTMEYILERGLDRLQGVDRLILQPNVGESIVRRWMLRRNWLLTDETVIQEDGLFYEILTAVPIRTVEDNERSKALYTTIVYQDGVNVDEELQLLMGPYLLRHPTDILKAKWEDEVRKRERIMAQMDLSQSADAAEKKRVLAAETDQIKEVLTCLRTDKPSFS